MILSRLPYLALTLLLLAKTPASAQVLLKPKPLEGMKTSREVTNLVEQTLTIAGMEVKTASDSTMRFQTDAGKRDAQGRIAQKSTIESVRSNLTLPGGNLSFDSKINLAKSDVEQYAFILDAFRAMAGASFTLVVDADNRFVSVEGLEEILKPALPQANELLKAQFNADKFKKELERTAARYPEKPVKPGDTWDLIDELDLGSGQMLKVERRYEYVGTVERNGRTLHKISAPDRRVISLEVAPGSAIPFKFDKVDLHVAKSENTTLFDRERGQEVETSRVMHLKGKLALVINGMELPSELDLRIEHKDAQSE